MKDIIKRFSISWISWLCIWYILYLFFSHHIIVQTIYSEFNLLYYIVLLVVFLYIFVLFGIYPMYFKISKTSVFVIGLSLIVLWDTVLVNNSQNLIYIWDLVKVVWVVLTLLAWTNVLVSDKVKKQKEESKIEIIEI